MEAFCKPRKWRRCLEESTKHYLPYERFLFWILTQDVALLHSPSAFTFSRTDTVTSLLLKYGWTWLAWSAGELKIHSDSADSGHTWQSTGFPGQCKIYGTTSTASGWSILLVIQGSSTQWRKMYFVKRTDCLQCHVPWTVRPCTTYKLTLLEVIE